MLIESSRLQMKPFEMADADDVFGCITPAVARFMTWEPPLSLSEFKARRQSMLECKALNDLSLVIRRKDTGECLGVAALEGLDLSSPTLGLWLKEKAWGQGYGREVVSAVVEWASKIHGISDFTYPVASQNLPSRRIAEGLGGQVVGSHSTAKYEAVIYKILAVNR